MTFKEYMPLTKQINLINALHKIVADQGRPEAFKYIGPDKYWTHMLYAGDEENLLDSGKVPKINSEIAVTSFDPMRLFHESAGAGRIGYIFKGKPSYYFPSDAHSIRSPSGLRKSRLSKEEQKKILDTNREYEEEYNWDEAWLVPKKSKLVGLLCVTKENSLKDFIKNDTEGMDLIKKSPTNTNFIKIKSGKILRMLPP